MWAIQSEAREREIAADGSFCRGCSLPHGYFHLIDNWPIQTVIYRWGWILQGKYEVRFPLIGFQISKLRHRKIIPL